MSQQFFVGSYTSADFGTYKAQGKGIYTCRLEPSGEMKPLACFEDVVNPSYLTLDKSGRHLYAVREVGAADQPAVVALAIKDDVGLALLNTQPISGEGPCHLSLDEQEQFLAVANYGSGNVALFPVLENGGLASEAHSVQHEGRSVHPDRQAAPHAHAALFEPSGETVFVTDLGLDRLKRYRLNRHAAELELLDSVRTPAGAGPRHLVFHPEGSYLFVVNELASTLSLFRYTGSDLELVTTVTTLPENFQQETTGAAIRIHPSGKFVYTSNRGHDSLAVFSFDEAGTELKLIQTIATGGKVPRDFALDMTGKLVVVANQKSNKLVSFWLNEQTGKLEPTGYELSLGTPVSVAMC